MPRGIPKNIKTLEKYYPEIAKQWDYDMNTKEFGDNFNPSNVSYGSHKDAWWICEKRT